MLIRNAGETIKFHVKLTDSVTGSPVSLAGAIIYGAITKDTALSDDEADLFVTVSSHLDEVNGISLVTFEAEDTATLTAGYYTLGIKVILSGGDAHTILQDEIQIQNAIIKKTT